jgi:hypothetical protein
MAFGILRDAEQPSIAAGALGGVELSLLWDTWNTGKEVERRARVKDFRLSVEEPRNNVYSRMGIPGAGPARTHGDRRANAAVRYATNQN